VPFFFVSSFAGYTVGVMLALAFVTMLLVSLFRFGLLTAFSTICVFWIVIRTPFTSDLGNWYAGHMILGLSVLLALLGFGFYTSLAGQPIFRDVLQEQRPGV
jgi:hypothetical protein